MIDNIEDIANLFLSTLESMCPKDHRSLVGTITINILDDDTAEIVIGSNDVRYAKHTNEYWKIDLEHIKRKGKIVKRPPSSLQRLKSKNTGGVNPNLSWIDNALKQTAQVLAEQNLGKVISFV